MSAADQAVAMRKMLDEELGDSILQRFLELEGEHEALQVRMGQVRSEFDVERAARFALEGKVADMGVQLQEAVEKSQRSLRAENRAVSAQVAAEARADDLQQELDRQARNTPEELKRRTAEAEAEAVRLKEECEKTMEKCKKEVESERAEKTQLALKLRELQAIEAMIGRKNARLRRGRGRKSPRAK